jgi:hypothetical protein
MEEDVDSTSSFLSYLQGVSTRRKSARRTGFIVSTISQATLLHKKTPYIADAVRNIWCDMSVSIVPDS